METSLLPQVYGWSAYLGAAATILTLITGILFFSVGQQFGKINDISAVFQVLFMIPLAIMFFQRLPSGSRTLGLLAALLGIAGMLTSALGQSLLVFGRIDFQASTRFFPAGAAIGAWLILASSLAAANDQLPHPLAWIGILAGAGYIATVIGFLRGGQQHVLFYIGALVLGVGYPIWAIWLGRLLLLGPFLTSTS
jgi:hypothetical protein